MAMPEQQPSEEQRTAWAKARTDLALERTFHAWLRTGLLGIATGLGLALLAVDTHPTFGLRRAMGLIISVVGGMMVVAAFRRYVRRAGPSARTAMPPPWLLVLLAALLLLGVLLAFVFLLLR